MDVESEDAFSYFNAVGIGEEGGGRLWTVDGDLCHWIDLVGCGRVAVCMGHPPQLTLPGAEKTQGGASPKL